jgi:hypothetical protein
VTSIDKPEVGVRGGVLVGSTHGGGEGEAVAYRAKMSRTRSGRNFFNEQIVPLLLIKKSSPVLHIYIYIYIYMLPV